MKSFLASQSICTSLLSFIFKANLTRRMSSCNQAYVRYLDTDDKMKINFYFGNSEFSERYFTFLRSKEENLEVTISRMQMKIRESMVKKSKNKKKTLNVDSLPQICVSLVKNNDVVDGSVKCIDAWTPDVKLKINSNIYEIIRNPPAVLHLSLPKNIMAGFPVYPKINLDFCSKDQCEFTWYRQISKSNLITLERDDIIKIKGESWLPLVKSFFYVTTTEDIGCKLKVSCFPKSKDKIGIEEYAISHDFVQLGPEKCPFEDRHNFTKELTNFGSLRCVSYNILADLYADTDTARNDLFPYCPTESLMVDYRKQLYLKEIIGYNADIICLQEVDHKVFNDDLVPVLSSTGLEGIYSQKGGQVVEGLSCFYRTDKFKLLESHAVILSDTYSTEPALQQIYLKIQENEKLKDRILNRTTVLQIVLLESKEFPNKRLLIGNTHLYFHPESDNIRLIQAASCILYIENLFKNYENENSTYTTAVLLSGDFNSCPEFGVYELMTTGNLSEKCADWNSNPEELVTGMPLTHSLSLKSACGTPIYTNYTENFFGCLDYIFYDESVLKVREIVPFPDHEQVVQNRGLPSKVFPSDHIALICTLDWK